MSEAAVTPPCVTRLPEALEAEAAAIAEAAVAQHRAAVERVREADARAAAESSLEAEAAERAAADDAERLAKESE